MGTARWDRTEWTGYQKRVSNLTQERLFSSRELADDFDPAKINLRESRDSAQNPESNAIIVALDVTGSMGILADELARQGLGKMFQEIINRKPVTDPHVMAMGIGDAYCDRAPLQVTQFEADIRIAKQLERIWLEKGGGGNRTESYDLPWLFAARKIAMDCFEKRQKKGYLFTIGDEEAPNGLDGADIERFCGIKGMKSQTSAELLAKAQEKFHVFHLIAQEGNHARSHPREVENSWRALLGQNALFLPDRTRLAEVIVSAIEISEGKDPRAVAQSWGKDAQKTLNAALAPMSAGAKTAKTAALA